MRVTHRRYQPELRPPPLHGEAASKAYANALRLRSRPLHTFGCWYRQRSFLSVDQTHESLDVASPLTDYSSVLQSRGVCPGDSICTEA